MKSIWRVGEQVLAVGPGDAAVLMGILNVTPDSFSDGGVHTDVDAAVAAALRMVDEGAAIIDVGGESTRPGAQRVDADEQIRRVVPVIQRLRERTDAVVSIDTTLSEVAQAAVEAGATIINDVSAGQDDARVLSLAAERRCGVVLMHRRMQPQDDSFSDQYDAPPQYDDVAATVRDFLLSRCEAAMAAGVSSESIAIDPGLGFGKTVQQNYELVRRFNELAAMRYPVLCAASRKSFIGAASGVSEPRQRVAGSLAVAVAAYGSGVRLFRVHDVAIHREALAVAHRIANPGIEEDE